MRIAFYSPLPPERSGIADYSFELLEELRSHVDIVAVVAEKQLESARAPAGVELVGASVADDLVVDCNLYQMGNNPKYHRFFFGRAFEEPGLLLLHDPSLGDFMAEMCGGADSAIFREEVAYDTPDIGLTTPLPLVDVGDGRKDLDRIRVLLARRIIESNIRTLVHSTAMAREMRQRYPGADIGTIQLPAPVLAERRPVRRRRKGEVSFGVFGGINYYKRVRPIVDAFLDVRTRHPLAHMVIAGRADDHLLERELRQIAARPELCSSLEIKTDLSLEALEHEIQRCDIGISLRWPTAGEMSATLMRTLGAGRPAIVSDVLQFRELDERFCWRVTTDFDLEHVGLVELMERAARDPLHCRAGGEAAREFVRREATYEVVAAQYVEHLEHCAARRVGAKAAQRPLSLQESRPLGVNIICPAGRGETSEAARRVANALRLSGVDVVVVELATALGLASQGPLQPPASLHRWLGAVGAPGNEIAGDGRADDGGAGGGGADEEEQARRAGDRASSALSRFSRDVYDDVLVARAVRALDPVDREIRAAGPHEVDWYFVEPAEAGRYGRLARVRRSRGHRIVAVLSPRWVPLTSTHQRLLELAEHVIVPSEFAAEIARLSSMAPVTVLPWPVDVAALPWPVDAVALPVPVGRATDGADATDAADPAEERQGSRAVATKSSDPGERPCVFTTVVPSGVAVARSNPSAAIAAFRRAFPPPARGPSSAELVVVLEDQARRPEATAALEADLASLNARLVVDPSKRELDALLSGTDVYVSLHRAEAFALRLADAMARAKVVLATGWSGNVDYMDRSTSISVGYTVRPLNWGDLFLDPGADTEIEWDSFWVDPDLDDAARWMRRLASDPGLRARLGVAASRWVRDRLAPAVVGASARACLERMVTEGSANGPPPGRHLTPAAAAGLRHG